MGFLLFHKNQQNLNNLLKTFLFENYVELVNLRNSSSRDGNLYFERCT
jgi:hypothetical protein